MSDRCVARADFVLVWEVRARRKQRGGTGEESSRSERRRAQLQQWREKFAQNLQAAGLLMEKVPFPRAPTHRGGLQQLLNSSVASFLQEETANEKKTIHFLKISAPWEVLVCYAEELCLRAPLQVPYRAVL